MKIRRAVLFYFPSVIALMILFFDGEWNCVWTDFFECDFDYDVEWNSYGCESPGDCWRAYCRYEPRRVAGCTTRCGN